MCLLCGCCALLLAQHNHSLGLCIDPTQVSALLAELAAMRAADPNAKAVRLQCMSA